MDLRHQQKVWGEGVGCRFAGNNRLLRLQFPYWIADSFPVRLEKSRWLMMEIWINADKW